MHLQGSNQDMRLVLEPGEAIGLTAVLWDIGAALKDTTGDPDCLAASASHEACWIEDDLGLPPWPNNARTRSTVAQFYEDAVRNMSRPTESAAAGDLTSRVKVSMSGVGRLITVLTDCVLAIGPAGLSSTAVHASSRALAWAVLLEEAVAGSPAPVGVAQPQRDVRPVLEEANRLLRGSQNG